MFHPRLYNIINAFSNLTAVDTLITCLQQKDYTTVFCIIFAALSSFFSHLAENHKHNLPGVLGLTPRQSYILNRIDVLAVSVTIAKMIVIYYHRYGTSLFYFKIHPKFTLLLLIALILNLASERVPVIAENPAYYSWCHSTWHILIFILVREFLINF